MCHTLLIEILTEELPPKSLLRIGEAFAEMVYSELQEKKFLGKIY